jgi:ribosomal protein S18 acetylase RimI-like enzyme
MPATVTSSHPIHHPANERAATVDATATTLLLAFADDPIIRWVFPQTLPYRAGFTTVVHALAEAALDLGAVDRTPDGAGAATWLRPEAQVPWDAALDAILAAVEPARRADVVGLLEAMEEQHPATPHWYLPFIGVEPYRQGRGLGSWLLRTGLARTDLTETPAYLEASSPRNRALYERHGYEVIGQIQVADSPPMWRMFRRPR